MLNSEKENLSTSRKFQFDKTKYFYLVLILSLVIAFPVLYSGFPIDGHDSPSQFNLYQCFAQQLRAGEWYPRWLVGMNDGFGSPVFFFYPPVSYYATTFFSFFTGAPTTASSTWHQLGFSAAAAIIGAGITCYLWLRETAQPWAASIGAVIYLLVPYHLSIDLFTRGALAEVWAFVWMPLILKFVRCLNKKMVAGFVGLAVSYALLIMTHLPTALIFSLVPVGYSLCIETGKNRKIRFLLVILGMGVGLGMADVYLLPALAARNYISMDPNALSSFYYENNFVLPFSAEQYSPYIFRLTILLATMITGIAFCLLIGRSEKLFNREWLFWLIVAGASIFMMTPLSQPVWQIFPILQSVQFPYRFNAVLCIAYAAIVTTAISNFYLSENKFAEHWSKKIFVYGSLLVSCVWIGLFVEAAFVSKPLPPYQSYIEKMYRVKLDFAEHMPRTAQLDQLDALIEERNKSGVPYLLRTDNQAIVSVDSWKPRDIDLSVNATNQTNLTVGQFYYPGWKGTILSESARETMNLPVTPSEEGLLSIQVPKGTSHLNLVLASDGAEKSGLTTSLASLAALGVLAFVLMRFKEKFGLEESKLING